MDVYTALPLAVVYGFFKNSLETFLGYRYLDKI